MERNNWFFRIYIGGFKKCLVGYKVDNWTNGPRNIFIYFPFIELFIQHSYSMTAIHWGGVVKA